MPEIEINPQLGSDKGGFLGGLFQKGPGGSSSAKPPESRVREAKPAPEGPILATFLARLGALVVDIVVLYMAALAANAVLREPLLGLGRGSALAAALVMIAYFALAAGPVGKGRSLGKYLLKLRVVALSGGPPDWRTSLPRALVMSLPLWGRVVVAVATNRVPFDGGDILGVQLLRAGLLSLLVANAICVIVDPLKRSFQDFATGTVVVKEISLTDGRAEGLREMVRDHGKCSPIQWLAVALPLVLFSMMTVMGHRDIISSGSRDKAVARLEEIQRILGTDHLRVMRPSYRKVPANALEDQASGAQSQADAAEPQAEAAQPQAGGPPAGPFALLIEILVYDYEPIPDALRESLARVEARMPELRRWVLDSVPDDTKDQIREAGLVSAGLEVNAREALDLGIRPFYGPPVLSFRGDFPPEDLPLLGIETSPSTSTLSQAP
jgi:uncharacterized RDD family membrane protein YckC